MANRRARGRRLAMAVPLLGAIALHGAGLAFLLRPGPDRLTGGGHELETISVDVVVMPASAFLGSKGSAGSAASTPAQAAPSSAHAPPEQTAVPKAAAPAPSATPQHPAVVEPLATNKTVVTPPEPSTSAPSNTPHAAPEETAFAPREANLPDLALLPITPETERRGELHTPPRPLPASSQVLTTATLPPRTAVRPRQPPPAQTTSTASTATVAAIALPSRRARRASAASAGELKAFNTAVVQALARTQPARPVRKVRGTVKVEFTIDVDGGLAVLKVLRSSDHRALDAAAVAAVRAARFPVPPPGLDAPLRTYVIPYIFR
ncbi:MAG: TonB family protein [Hyphomicrobiaceae bacterium]